jgi:alkylation response protein AidB-like acyl-CoA dehydrogenase
VNDCIQLLLDGTLKDEAAYKAKRWCSEQQCKGTDECLQLFGGYGYMVKYPHRSPLCGFSRPANIWWNHGDHERPYCQKDFRVINRDCLL